MHVIDLGADRKISRPEVVLCTACVGAIVGYAAAAARAEAGEELNGSGANADRGRDPDSGLPGGEALHVVVLGDRPDSEGAGVDRREPESAAGGENALQPEGESASESGLSQPKKNSRRTSHKK